MLNRYCRWISYIVCPKEAVENSAFSEVNVHAAPPFSLLVKGVCGEVDFILLKTEELLFLVFSKSQGEVMAGQVLGLIVVLNQCWHGCSFLGPLPSIELWVLRHLGAGRLGHMVPRGH